jgi:hypothetical protein
MGIAAFDYTRHTSLSFFSLVKVARAVKKFKFDPLRTGKAPSYICAKLPDIYVSNHPTSG